MIVSVVEYTRDNAQFSVQVHSIKALHALVGDLRAQGIAYSVYAVESRESYDLRALVCTVDNQGIVTHSI